jgi:hypothetical protein
METGDWRLEAHSRILCLEGIDLTSFGSSAGSLSTSSYTVVSLLFLFEIENLLRNPEFDPVENVSSRRRWKHPDACSVIQK